MIPERRRAQLPPGHWYLVHQPRHGRLIVTVSTLVPPDSELEQELVRTAVRAWQQHQRRGLVLLPAPIAGGAGLGWLVRQLRRPGIAAGVAVATAGVALAVVPLVEPHTPARQPPAIAAPPVRPTAPGRSTAPHKTAKAAPKPPAARRPVSHPAAVVADVSTSRVRVEPARLPVRLPVHVPPVHVRPPKVPVPPVSVMPPPPVSPTKCRLVRLEVGRLVHICL